MQVIIRQLSLVSLTVFLTFFSDASPDSEIRNKSHRILESWRWHHLEALDGFNFFCGTESQNGELLFAADIGIISFDGLHAKVIKFPDGCSGLRVYSIYGDSDDRIFVCCNYGLLRFDHTGWTTLLWDQQRLFKNLSLFAQNSEGLFIVGTNSGIFKIQDGELLPCVAVEKGIGNLQQIGKKLYGSFRKGSVLFSCDFTEDAIRDKASWKTWDLEVESFNGACFEIFEASEDEIVALHVNPKVGIYRYDKDKDDWFLNNLPNQNEFQGFYSWGALEDGAALVFSKTRTLLRHLGEWNFLNRTIYQQPTNMVFSFKRKNGNLIIGGRGESIIEVDLTDSRWKTYEGLHYQCDDYDNRSWFINRKGDVVSYNNRSRGWQTHSLAVIDTPNLILCSNDGFIWAAGSHQGEAAISYYNGQSWTRAFHPELGDRIGHHAAHEFSDGRIIFGSANESSMPEVGAIIYERTEDGYQSQQIPCHVLPQRISSFAETSTQQIWFSGFDLGTFDSNLRDEYQLNELSGIEWVDHIAATSDGLLFLGLWQKGIGIYNGENWEWVDQAEKLASRHVVYILPDRKRDNNVWVATQDGVSRYDQGDWIAHAMPREFGVVREEGKLAQSEDGAIWLNQTDRSWFFATREERIGSDKEYHTIRYQPASGAPIINIIRYDEVTTEPANVHVAWQGIDEGSKTPMHQLRYSYRLNKDKWSPYSTQTETILLNVRGGKHHLELRVKDDDGNVGSLTQPVTFLVQPPVWKRTWFILTTIFILGSLLLLVYLLIRQRFRHVLQLDEIKLQFFTNLSHELRTPLTLIIGPLEALLSKLPHEVDQESAEVAYLNSKKMLHLVDQILEFRKIEYKGSEVVYVQQDVMPTILSTIEQLRPLADEKAIDLVFTFSEERFVARYDHEKLERILSNLLNNAIKYTQEQGTIIVKTRIELEEGQAHLLLVVEDNGMGIRSDKIGKIFEPFYRVTQRGKPERGVGLGLSLVKSLIDAIDGKIEVESPVTIDKGTQRGTRFTVQMPLLLNSVRSEDSLSSDEDLEVSLPDFGDENVILVVEDDAGVRSFLSRELSDPYTILTASNGVEGLTLARKVIPNLIITDVLMPEMDGNEFCEKVREHQATSHIPIIVLTALKNQQHELNSLAKGADDFLSKPVSIQILKQKIHNAIQSRITLQQAYQRSSDVRKDQPTEHGFGSADDQFIDSVRIHVEQRISDVTFDVEGLSESLGMSRMTLYRKMKMITGDSPSAFVRTIRLKKAVQYLSEGVLNVSEIADKVGFQDVSHFSATFKKYYHCTPTQYSRDHVEV